MQLDAKLVDALGTPVAFAPHYECHRNHTYGCGWTASISGDKDHLGDGEYTLVATVRLVLEEGQTGDPWVVVHGTTPADTSQGICAPGGVVARCELRLPVLSTRA